jgi:predicted nucleotidyltransferase
MGIIGILSGAGAEAGKPFLVIGGYAVNAHGYARETVDLDILTRREEREFWKKLVLENGYSVWQERDNFAQFKTERSELMPVDFMFVNEHTFASLFADAVESTLGGVRVKHPSLRHLIALKLHVLKQELPHRTLRDFNDVLELLRINRVDTSAEDFKQLCLRYGNQKLYETLVRGTR